MRDVLKDLLTWWSAGETVGYEWGPDGAATRVRAGGISSWPVEVFRAQRAGQVRRALAG